MKRLATVLLLVSILVMSVSTAQATTNDGHRFGVGLQMIPGMNDGISFTWDLTKQVTINPVLDFGLDAVGFEARYAFLRERRFDLFAYPCIAVGGEDVDFGGGAGVDWDWRGLDRGLPPICWNLQLGLSAENGFSIGAGVHYVFGK